MHAQKDTKIYHSINASPAVQQYMCDVCAAFQDILHCMCAYHCLKSKLHQADPDNLIPEPWVFMQCFSSILSQRRTQTYRDSGSVQASDIIPALVCGNVRERCQQIVTLFCKAKDNAFVYWLCHAPVELLPTCICPRHLQKIRTHFETHKHRHKKRQLFDSLLVFIDTRKTRVRRPHCDRSDKSYLLSMHSMVPTLSAREMQMVKQHVKQDQDKLPWTTGRSRWIPLKLNCLPARTDGKEHEMVCGLSGHTERMINFCMLLTSFDIEKTALICVLWLVPCDHHSIFEVLYTASLYGLDFDPASDPEAHVYALLQKHALP